MSILIKGIDMPSKPTQIKIYPNGIIFCADEDGVYVPKAKAIQIDRPHGRLIDRDDIYISRWDIDSDLAEQIQNAPTILEAEE